MYDHSCSFTPSHQIMLHSRRPYFHDFTPSHPIIHGVSFHHISFTASHLITAIIILKSCFIHGVSLHSHNSSHQLPNSCYYRSAIIKISPVTFIMIIDHMLHIQSGWLSSAGGVRFDGSAIRNSE